MLKIKSLGDLKRTREDALEKRKLKIDSGIAQVSVAMGTCGIAVGAGDTMKAILNYIEDRDISGVVVTQTGCTGMCEREPIVQVTIGEKPKVIYGKVSPEIAERIMKEHVQAGYAVEEFIVTGR